MKASETDILFIPGHGNSGVDHWQTRWQSKLASARRVEQDSWHEPVRDDWVRTIADSINAAKKPVVLVAHSLGISPALHALADCRGKVAGAFFVAPPDLVEAERLPPGLARDRFHSFGPYPREPLPFPSITVASRDDPYGTFEHAGDIANAWGSFLVDAGNSGHINVDSGHGPWPEGTMVFAQFLSRLKPITI
jgi:hypothetical protein